jgi:pyridoxine/pyridoxamine 5'-phosphate oxidase
VVFASSDVSHKGRDLQTKPVTAGTLWWRETMQQVNFYGIATKLPAHLSDLIFAERTLEAQAVAALSCQSSLMTDEAGLRDEIAKLTNKSEKIVRPNTWHGYHIEVQTIEFWHGSKDRFHHRLRYGLDNGTWRHQKLQP